MATEVQTGVVLVPARHQLSPTLLLLTSLCLPTKALAQQSSGHEPSIAAEALVGFGTPVGLLGAAVEIAPTRHLVLSNGVGYSFSGPQAATMLHLRTAETLALRLGAGLSTGPYHGNSGLACVGCMEGHTPGFGRYWSRAIWANLEVSLELYRPGKHGWRGFFGVAMLTNPGDGVCKHRSVDGISMCDNERGAGAVLYVGWTLRLLWLL